MEPVTLLTDTQKQITSTCQHKKNAKKYYDRKKNVKKSHVRLGDRVLMKDKRTDRLRPEGGILIGTTEHSVTVQFGNGRKKKNRDEEQIRYELYDTDESDEEFDEQNTLRTKSGREIRKPERFGDWTV